MNSQQNRKRSNRTNQRYLHRKIEKMLSILKNTRIRDKRVLISGNLNNIIILSKLVLLLRKNKVIIN